VDGALRMQILVQDLLTFSRVGRQGGSPALINCQTVVDMAVKNLEAAVWESAAKIECAHLPTIFAEASQLTQLFQNLIGNAIKFRGTEPPCIHITAEECGEESTFTVMDNGIGIAPEHKELVFAIFKRLHTREEYPGSGIGLAICKKIVEQHDGRIWVESVPGRGSAFRFTLPAAMGKVAHDQLGQNQG
jgi:light-regulated signal transduction histidine kinase (bacteriophytochrome)